jgi:hypothetical protein
MHRFRSRGPASQSRIIVLALLAPRLGVVALVTILFLAMRNPQIVVHSLPIREGLLREEDRHRCVQGHRYFYNHTPSQT